MAVLNWPPGLPSSPQKGFTETGGVNIVRTPTDKGVAKMRYRGTKASVFNFTFLMTSEQVATLETFVKSTTLGVKRFNFTHPRTGIVQEFRILPQGDGGDYYTISYVAPEYWSVSLQFELLP